MANRAVVNGPAHVNVSTKVSRCASSVGDANAEKPKVGWGSPRDLWRNLSLRKKTEVSF